jgi:hypothetical protein
LEKLIRLIQVKLTNLEEAFTTTFQRQIKVTLEVVEQKQKNNNLLPPPIIPESLN